MGMMYKSAFDFFTSLPDVSTLPTHNNDASSKVYDRNGKLLYKFYSDVNRTPISLSEIPLSVKQATIATEDRDFYSHKGVSFKALSRAFIKWIRDGGQLTGASTLTQQLVKNVYLSPERTLDRKISEMILALQVEERFTKDQILEMYLNRVPYGGASYGVQEASHLYFGKDIQTVNLSEAAFIASRPQNPSTFFEDRDRALTRKNIVLNQMYEMEYITEKEKREAQAVQLAFQKDQLFSEAPHFVIYVGGLLASKYGHGVFTNGYSITSTISDSIQSIAEEEVEKELKNLARLKVSNAGVLVISVQTGEILAMVGSRNYNDSKNDGTVNTTTSLRQPGSSIKVVNYAYALSHGFTPASILDDIPTVFTTRGAPPYKPENYDGTYKGKISLRSALAQSRNIPAVKVLNSYGVSNMIDLGNKMGITTWEDRNRFGLSLTLGGGEVRLIDLAQVYLTIANYGKRIPITPFKSIVDLRGDTQPVLCSDAACTKEQVLDPRVAYQLISILSDNAARTPAFGANSALVIPNHPEVAVKTGTSNNLRDNLTVGFNKNYLVAVWVGNNDGSPMSRVASGVTGASPIWNGIMKRLLEKEPSTPWPIPGGIVEISGCGGTREWFIQGTEPKNPCVPNELAKEKTKFSLQ